MGSLPLRKKKTPKLELQVTLTGLAMRILDIGVTVATQAQSLNRYGDAFNKLLENTQVTNRNIITKIEELQGQMIKSEEEFKARIAKLEADSVMNRSH